MAAERVADDVRRLEARVVHRTLDEIGEHRVADLPLDRRPAGMPGQGHGQHVVLVLQRGEHELPGCATCR